MRQFESYKPFLAAAIDLVEKRNPTIYAEYGPGESTRLFLERSKEGKIFSVEHDMVWYEKVKDLSSNRCMIQHKPLGKEYFAAPFDSAVPLVPNLVFVDGRRRVESMIYGFEHSSKDAILLLHDAHRKKYHGVMRMSHYLIWAGIVGDRTLIMCKTRADFDALKHLQTSSPKLS